MSDQTASDLLKHFRLVAPVPYAEHRETLHEEFGISADLVSRLYDAHDACRRKLARVELKIYYSLISDLERKMREVPADRRRYESSALISWQNFINYVNNLEQLLNVRYPRAEKLRQQVEKWKKGKTRT